MRRAQGPSDIMYDTKPKCPLTTHEALAFASSRNDRKIKEVSVRQINFKFV